MISKIIYFLLMILIDKTSVYRQKLSTDCYRSVVMDELDSCMVYESYRVLYHHSVTSTHFIRSP